MSNEEEIKPEIRRHYRPFEDPPGNVQGCTEEDSIKSEILYDVGDVWRHPWECNRKTCTRDGTIIEEVCPEPKVPEGCIRIRGLTDEYQSFPYCCDRVACPGDDEYWEPRPDYPQQCDDRYCVRDIGEEWSEHKYGICNKKRCGLNKYNEAEIFEDECPKIEIPKGCELEAYPDLTKEFPDCCPKVVCPKNKLVNQTGRSVSGKTEVKNSTNAPVPITDMITRSTGQSASDKTEVKNSINYPAPRTDKTTTGTGKSASDKTEVKNSTNSPAPKTDKTTTDTGRSASDKTEVENSTNSPAPRTDKTTTGKETSKKRRKEKLKTKVKVEKQK